MVYPKEKYKIVIHQHPEYLGTEIIAYSTYAGKRVCGKAICHKDDNYDEQKGIDLAVARCAAKVAKKRVARAGRKFKEAQLKYSEARSHYNNMEHYMSDAIEEYQTANEKVNQLLAEL